MHTEGVPMTKWLGLLLALFTASGCGKDDAEKFADAYCAELAKCCALAGQPGDGKACHEIYGAAAAFGSYDAKAGDACLAEMRAEVSAGTFCDGGNAISACDAVYGSSSVGNKKVGEPCDFSDDCAPSSAGEVACDFLGSKTCVLLLPVGASCKASTDCVSAAYCDYEKSLCTARAPAGGDCVLTSDCLEGYYCPSATNQCTPQKNSGAACTSFSECRSTNCADGTCKPSITFGC
jgi:hypothetical protein